VDFRTSLFQRLLRLEQFRLFESVVDQRRDLPALQFVSHACTSLEMWRE
jgi:hypothetical protein